MIAAVGKGRELGKDNELVWRFSKDMKFFRNQTKGHTVVMGRKTFESLPGMLPNRHHIVISRTQSDFGEGVEVFASLEAFLEAYKEKDEVVYVIGGAQIYTQMLPYASKLVLTEIDAHAPADAYFPEVDVSSYTRTVLDASVEDGVSVEWVEYCK